MWSGHSCPLQLLILILNLDLEMLKGKSSSNAPTRRPRRICLLT